MAMVRTVPSETRVQQGIDVRVESGGRRVIEGVVATWDNWVDLGVYQERMDSTLFDVSLSRSSDNIKLLLHHEHRAYAVGKPLEWRKGDGKLEAVFELGDSERAIEAHKHASEHLIDGLSVGFRPGGNDGDNTWSDELTRVRRHRNARLLEVSLVTVPANEDARVTLVRSAGPPEPELSATPNLDRIRERLKGLQRRK